MQERNLEVAERLGKLTGGLAKIFVRSLLFWAACRVVMR